MNYSNVDEKRKELMSPESEQEFVENDKFQQRKFANKDKSPIRSNGNISNKRGAISFNIGRIMPRNMTQDKQFLYEQNIKLKQSVQQFRDEVTKLRTRLSATQKQKTKIVEQFSNSDLLVKNPTSRIKNQRSGSMTFTSMHNQNFLKKALRQSKDEINLLKVENAKLKKTVKYTEINELQIQNKHLIDQCLRLSSIISSKVLDQNEYADSYQRKIEELKQEIMLEKDNYKAVANQIKKKNEEIQELKSQNTELSLREKKLKKELSELKKTSQSDRKTNSSNKNFKFNDQKQCEKCGQLTKQLKAQKQKTSNLEKQLQTLRKSQLSNKNEKVETKGKQITNSNDKLNSIVKVNTQNESINKTNGKPAQKRAESKNNVSEDQGYEDEFEENNQNQYEDNFQKQEVVQEKAPKPKQQVKKQDKKVDKKQPKKQQKQRDEYEQEFDEVYDDNSQKQEILYEKQKKQRPQDQVLKETISYRLMSQRYSYNDLSQDIKQSGMTEFTIQQIASMLNDEPFFLSQEQIQFVLSAALARNDLHLQEKIKTKEFVKKIKPFITDLKILPEQKQQQYMYKTVQKLQSAKKKLVKKWSQVAGKKQTITKQQFTQELRALKFTKQSQELLLGQACMVSNTIEQINYNALIEKMCS